MGNSPEFDRAVPRIAGALEDVSIRLADLADELRSLAQGEAVEESAQTAAPEPERGPATAPEPERRPTATPEPARGPGTPPEPVGPPSPFQMQPMRPFDETYRSGGNTGLDTFLPPPPTLAERFGAEGAGSRLLVWIGGAVTLVGVVLMMILAIQRGWIGPMPRVVIGAALACGLVALSLRAHRTQAGRAGAFALAATGIAALYLDLVAATTLLDLLPAVVGLGAGLVVAVAGLVLAARWDAEPFAVFVLLGCAAFAPFIVQEVNALLLGFLLVLQVASAPVQLIRGWQAVPLIAGLPSVIAAIVLAQKLIERDASWAAAGAALTATMLTAIVAVVSVLRRRDDETSLLLLVSSAVPVLVVGMLVPRDITALTVTVFAASMLALWVIGLVTDRLPAGLMIVAGGLALACGFYLTAVLLSGDARTITMLAGSLLLSVVSVLLRSTGALIAAAIFAVAGFGLATAAVARPEMLFQVPAEMAGPAALGMSALAFGLIGTAALAVLLAYLRLFSGDRNPDADSLWQVLAGLVTLYGACGLTLSLALLASPDRTGFLAGHSIVTVSWMVVALGLLHRGITRSGPRIAGLVLVGAVLFKLVLFDLAALDGIARVATFLGAGLVLLLAGVRYTRLVAQHAQQES